MLSHFNREGKPLFDFDDFCPSEYWKEYCTYEEVSWNQANETCAAIGQQLVSIRNFEELNLLLDFIRLYHKEDGTGVFVANNDVSIHT